MQVKLDNTFTVDQPVERVWAYLSDPRKVATCMPGAEILEAVDERTYLGAVKLKLGPFSAQFKGEIVIEQMDAGTHEIRMVGKGKDVKGTGSATMTITGKLTALSGTQTQMASTSDLIISGKMAQFGARMVEDVSKSMFNKFTAALNERLAAESSGADPAALPAAGDAISVTDVAKTVVKGAMGRMFGKADPGDPEA